MSSPHPTLARLATLSCMPPVTAQTLPELLARGGMVALLCAGDPVRYPECTDVAVVLPELRGAFGARFELALAAPELEAALQARYGLNQWPSVVFLRDGGYVGAIGGMQDWDVYLRRCAELLDAPVTRPPSIGIAVAAAATGSCH